ncbi:uncharacterized protein LOC108044505 [Drosophila rhopaloa]|uniref:Uncharacterized protein LOC108044505 n=1 Tax=Drosophila rhopaloa TaxID=1041015 RepID=A0A6P4ELH1_DRORH|nr:uncharacterized protein LOC108044505 [Drosophila rhopaloa]
MSLRLVLFCLAILAMAYAQPAPGAPEIIEMEEPSEGPSDDTKPRTLLLLLPLLFPSTFYVP